ncbi:RAI1-domain-containing protein [Ceratobasidium sp. AG-I]|nr:RAI1-domain-containing protein [Ceratobasidium sp. AG-I]
MPSHEKEIRDPNSPSLPEAPLTKQLKPDEGHTSSTIPIQYTLAIATPTPQRPPAFGQPQQLTCFSYTPERDFRFDTSALKYYVPAPIGADLGYRYEHWIKRPEERARIDSLLRAVEQEHITKELKKGAFVTWRGVMTKLMIAPFETRDPVDLNLMLLDGCIYAEEHSDDTKIAEKETVAPRLRRFMYYGYAFESFSTWHEPVLLKEQRAQRDRVRSWSGDVDTNVQYCSVVKTKIDAERMIIGGEVDCCRDQYTGQPDSYVELKTSMVIRNAQDEQRFEQKLLKFWAQSFLLGVPEVVVGFRNHQGRLTTLQTFQTLALPRMVRGKPGAWDPNICLAFAGKLLQFIRSTLEEDSQNKKPAVGAGDTEPAHAGDTAKADASLPAPTPRQMQAVWRLSIRPGEGNVTLNKISPEEVEIVQNGEDRVGFLPTWFWNSVTRPQS